MNFSLNHPSVHSSVFLRPKISSVFLSSVFLRPKILLSMILNCFRKTYSRFHLEFSKVFVLLRGLPCLKIEYGVFFEIWVLPNVLRLGI